MKREPDHKKRDSEHPPELLPPNEQATLQKKAGDTEEKAPPIVFFDHGRLMRPKSCFPEGNSGSCPIPCNKRNNYKRSVPARL